MRKASNSSHFCKYLLDAASVRKVRGERLSDDGGGPLENMTDKQRSVVKRLREQGDQLLSAERVQVRFKTGNEKAEELLNDLKGHPHFFLLACLMDRQIDARLAWIIPYKVGEEAGGFEFGHFENLSEKKIAKMFERRKLHRFNKLQPRFFHAAIQDIRKKYSGDASMIWAGKPQSATVVRRFLEFAGAGIKIATMAANILVRDFKVPMADHSSIDISPDSRVMRFFKEHGLLRPDGTACELIYLARELNPEYPGLLDFGAWQDGAAVSVRQARNVVEGLSDP